ncbi:27438_t:CDS:2, partial [Racocetra persica]
VVLSSPFYSKNKNPNQDQDQCPSKAIPKTYKCRVYNQVASATNECDSQAICAIHSDVAGQAYLVQCQSSSPACNAGLYPAPVLSFKCGPVVPGEPKTTCELSCNTCFTNPDSASNPNSILCIVCGPLSQLFIKKASIMFNTVSKEVAFVHITLEIESVINVHSLMGCFI